MRKGSFIVTAVLVAALLPVFLFAQGGLRRRPQAEPSGLPAAR